MDFDHKPHFRTTSIGHNSNTTTTTTNELFICFTSRLSSSSSMKLTKSILSPGRATRDGASAVGPVSLSSSLSRRLRSNGSLKGGASPFLSTAGKRRGGGAGFENPEPSSPKVTCIGQVRVKTKKKVKQTRSLSQRRSGEISFRRTHQQQHSTADVSNSGGGGDKDKISGNHQQNRFSNAGGAHYPPPPQQQPAQECLPHRNQRWVHLPISICEALRDFSCLFPCKSSCFSREHKPESKQVGPGDENGCGAVFARWLVSVNDGESGKRREIELVVGDVDEEEEAAAAAARSSRRHVFDDIEVKDDDRIEVKGRTLEEGGGEEENGRVSICIPPKNALLLMRCRSDPMKMASLANRFSWDAQGVCENVCENIEVEKLEVSEEQGCEGNKNEGLEQEGGVLVENDEEQEVLDEAIQEILESMEDNKVDELLDTNSEEMVEEDEKEDLQQEIVSNEEKLVENEEDEVESNISSFEALLDQENTENYEDSPFQEENNSPSICHLSPSTESDVEINKISSVPEEEEEALVEKENEENVEEEEESNTTIEKDSIFADIDKNWVKSDPETTSHVADGQEKEELNTELMEKPENRDLFEEPKKEKILPDCLLLMMCEPKLSMEVSKETWVCSTDFIRWLPERPSKTAEASAKACCGYKEPVKRRLSIDSKLSKPPVRNNYDKPQQQPPRSSCSLPAAAVSMATVIEQKLVNAVGYEPFVLTRCKSEPMRTASAKLIPESCLIWKNTVRKMEPHRRAAAGVGAAGVGY